VVCSDAPVRLADTINPAPAITKPTDTTEITRLRYVFDDVDRSSMSDIMLFVIACVNGGLARAWKTLPYRVPRL
jgi:hypothetical protein